MCNLFFVDYESLPDHYDLADLIDMQKGDFLALYYSVDRIDIPIALINQLNNWNSRGCNLYLNPVDDEFDLKHDSTYYLAIYQCACNIHIVSDDDKYLAEEARWSGTDKHVYLVSTKSKDKNMHS